MSNAIAVRKLYPGMGQAVAERTILRKKPDGSYETWGEVAHRVAMGNAMLSLDAGHSLDEYLLLNKHIAQASILLSGRHLQHGDETQPSRNQEVFTNCSTAAASYILFYLLLNGSGVGRCYDDDLILVNWDHAPNLRVVLSNTHPDFDWSAHEDVRDAMHKYGPDSKNVMWYKVPDSREGWAQALEVWENAAFEKIHKDKMLILDFTQVRERGRPIGGMQDRPASGPVPLMNAFMKAASLKGSGIQPWKQAMYIDHYFSECVLVGGARRAARMSTKIWSDPDIIDFIRVKRPIEFDGKTVDEVLAYRKTSQPYGFLWSSNNSVSVDAEFWDLLDIKRGDDKYNEPMTKHARKVWKEMMACGYGDGTGEPGILNVDKLQRNDDGWEKLTGHSYAGSNKYQIREETEILMSRLAKRAKRKKYNMIVNPCVTGDTWILTSEGPRQVHELINKTFDAIVDGKAYKATGFWKTGTRQTFKIVTERGYEIRLTENHKVLVETGRKPKTGGGYNIETTWIEAGRLKVGDKIVMGDHRRFEWEGDGTFEQGWLLGEMVGDGCYNPKKYSGLVRFWGENRRELALEAAAIVATMNPPYQWDGPRHQDEYDRSEVTTKVLDKLADGLIEPESKKLLPSLERMSSKFVRGFIRGFFDADGTVLMNRNKGVSIRLAQSDLSKLKTVQRMLARLGIASSIYENRRNGCKASILPDGNGGTKPYQVQPSHELVISKSNIYTFEDKIGFRDPTKAAALADILDKRKRIPYQERFTSAVREIVVDQVEDVYDCTVDTVHRFDANGLTVHNCGEIALSVLGGYCVIADVVPYFANTLDEAEEAFRVATRALMRVNMMDSFYKTEVQRTNRIGVGMTGVHEFAWKFFRVGFRDLINPNFEKHAVMEDNWEKDPTSDPRVRAASFWRTLERFNAAVKDEAIKYAQRLGVNVPHTATTIKPAGTTSKLFGLTEGWHLPTMRYYLRWVQFRSDDPLVKAYADNGYPTRELKTYEGTTIVGFPTAPLISTLGLEDKLITASEATPEEQYKWLQLGERHWIIGNGKDMGNQISYTLKYDPERVDAKHFAEMIRKYQKTVRACSVMPQEEQSSYEYLPEEGVDKVRYEEISRAIKETLQEDISKEHIDCATGACPVDFKQDKESEAA